MRKIVLLLSLIVFIGCDKEKEEKNIVPDSSFIGTWDIETYIYNKDNLSFRGEGKFIAEQEDDIQYAINIDDKVICSGYIKDNKLFNEDSEICGFLTLDVNSLKIDLLSDKFMFSYIAKKSYKPNPGINPGGGTSKQCMATTKKGTRCKRKASSGSSYCWQHQ